MGTRAARAPGAGRAHVGTDPANGLQPGSDPSVLPGPVLIADRDNNRLVEVSPSGQVLWRFPAPGDLAPAQTFNLPDDAFFSPGGKQVIVTQEDDFVISVVDIAHRRIVYRYGHPGVPGSEPGYLHNPDDALLTPSGDILTADIKNCRLLVIRPPAHRPLRQLGTIGACAHQLGSSYGSPNGAFPMSNGGTVVTEINGDWMDVLSPRGTARLGYASARLHLSIRHQPGPSRAVPVGRLHEPRSDRDLHERRQAAVAVCAHGAARAQPAVAGAAAAQRGHPRQRRQERRAACTARRLFPNPSRAICPRGTGRPIGQDCPRIA